MDQVKISAPIFGLTGDDLTRFAIKLGVQVNPADSDQILQRRVHEWEVRFDAGIKERNRKRIMAEMGV